MDEGLTADDLARLAAAVAEVHATVAPERLGPEAVASFGGLTFPKHRAQWAAAPEAHVAVGLLDPQGQPLGLALALREGPHAHLVSVFVQAPWRQQGHGRALLAALSAQLAAEGVVLVQGSYLGGGPHEVALERLLYREGWSLPQPRMLLFRVPLEGLKGAPWMRHAQLAEGDELRPWGRLSEAERAALWAGLAEEGWAPEDLHPERHEAGCDPDLSLALLREGQVVGWAIGRGMDAAWFRLDTGWVRPELQRAGRLFALYSEVGHAALRQGFSEMSWSVPLVHGRKAAFARRWMAPGFAHRTSYGVQKFLDGRPSWFLDREGLAKVLPHRAPFALLDGLLACEPGQSVVGLMRVNPRDPVLAGHFPGEPIFPGVLLVEAMAQAVVAMMKLVPEHAERTYLFGGADGVRFKRPVRPGEVVRVEGRWTRGTGRAVVAEAKAFVGEEEVAAATLIAGTLQGSGG